MLIFTPIALQYLFLCLFGLCVGLKVILKIHLTYYFWIGRTTWVTNVRDLGGFCSIYSLVGSSIHQLSMGPYQGSDCYDDGIYISQGPVRKGEATLV